MTLGSFDSLLVFPSLPPPSLSIAVLHGVPESAYAFTPQPQTALVSCDAWASPSSHLGWLATLSLSRPHLRPLYSRVAVSALSLLSLSLSLHSPSPTPPLSPALLLFSRQSREREREKEKQIHKGRRLFFAPFASRPSSLRRMFASFKRKGSGAAAAAAAQPSAVRLQESEEDKGEREGDAARFWRCLSLPLSLARLPSLPATVATKRRMRVNGAHLSSFLFTREREREGGRERKRRGEKQRKVSFLPSHPFPFPFLPPPLRLSHSHTLCHCRRLRWTSTRRPPHTTARRLASTSSTL